MSNNDHCTDDTQQEWEIGVRRIDTGEWEHYHPKAKTKEEAKEKALDSAQGIGIDSIADRGDPVEVYMASGPYEPADPVTRTVDTDTQHSEESQ